MPWCLRKKKQALRVWMPQHSETRKWTERTHKDRVRTQGGPSTNPFIFYCAGSPEQMVAKESPLTTKLRKQRGKEGLKDGNIEKRRIINDIEIEFVIEVFLSFM